ncbi:hypothetical protein [uncultured Chryseobacterium sp.]|uniref:hypothetical protein n=1 Tax=uncultured Chryseobacterium sp. TaxID=259322 RepID=UPI0025F7C548|nr:hypothetical protein [uncultured Chryseobacterium sp.]
MKTIPMLKSKISQAIAFIMFALMSGFTFAQENSGSTGTDVTVNSTTTTTTTEWYTDPKYIIIGAVVLILIVVLLTRNGRRTRG